MCVVYFLSINSSSSSGATVTVEDLLKMAVLVSVSYPRVSEFCYLNFTCEDYQVPKALKKCLQSTVIQNGTQASKEEAIS